MIRYFQEIFSGLWSLLVGMGVTARMSVAPHVTTHYPFDTLEVTPNYRGHIDLVINAKTRRDKCIVCGMCERTCPSSCISLAGEKPEGAKKKVLTRYDLDFTKCSLCANCVEVCPVAAIEFSNDYQLAGTSRHDFHFDLVERFEQRARAQGIDPLIGDLTPPPPKPVPEPASDGAEA